VRKNVPVHRRYIYIDVVNFSAIGANNSCNGQALKSSKLSSLMQTIGHAQTSARRSVFELGIGIGCTENLAVEDVEKLADGLLDGVVMVRSRVFASLSLLVSDVSQVRIWS
jgi:hypothetical protein